VSKQEPVHRVNHRRRKRAVHQITDVAYLENLAERLSDQTGLPLHLAHNRVMALAVSARSSPATPFFGDRGR